MKLKIQNLGVIKSATVDLSKKFTIFCGPNSTGKTYLSYIVYAFYFTSLSRLSKVVKTMIKSIREQSYIELTDVLINEILQSFADDELDNIDEIFGVTQDKASLFTNFKIEAIADEEDYKRIVGMSIDVHTNVQNRTYYFHKAKKSRVLYVETETLQVEKNVRLVSAIEDILLSRRLNSIFRELLMSDAAMLTVERNSIYTFKNELLGYNSRLVEAMQKIDTDENLRELLENNSTHYPMAIRRNLDELSRFINPKSKSEFMQYGEVLEEKLLHGQVSLNENGDVIFTMAEESGKVLPLHISSSIVKTVSSLVLYLKHAIEKGDMILIDEPEINLHPTSQIELSHILSEIVNNGARIAISTHSDYIVREINNMIMAKALVDKGSSEMVAEFGYTTNQLLNKEDVAVYLFMPNDKGQVIVKSSEISEYGFSIPSIDDTIRKQNKVTNTFYEVLKYGE
ncbi:MAG: ATP-binding protein [Bacteroidales bacterium]|jgi:predicted ATPase|nr:ATP-binding protein [Bacteroidales bacterium]